MSETLKKRALPADPEPDSPPLTDAMISSLRPGAEVFAKLGIDPPRGRPRKSNAKVSLTLRLDPDIVDHFRETGQGWQTRINDALRQVVQGTDRTVEPRAARPGKAGGIPAKGKAAAAPEAAKPRKIRGTAQPRAAVRRAKAGEAS